MTLFLAIMSAAAYLAGAEYTAKWRYRATRPYTEPLSCEHSSDEKYHVHGQFCYARHENSLINSRTEAALFAIAIGLVWPSVLLAWLAIRHVQSGDKPTSEELQARIEWLEKELGH